MSAARRRRSEGQQGTTASRPDLARRLLLAIGTLVGVLVVGTLGYMALGIDPLDAAYQAITTVTTVGFREVVPFGTAEKLFTMALILVGVGVVLYTLTLLLETLIEGQLFDVFGRHRMQRSIDAMSGHTVVYGWGRVGRATAHQLAGVGEPVVVVDDNPERVEDCPYPVVIGDATSDDVLRRAGVERAATLVSSLTTDAGSLYVTLSARAMNPSLTIIARSRTSSAEAKFVRAGADRVVNPQRIGGDRIAAFARQPNVVDFLDVAMHDQGIEFRLEDVVVAPGSKLAGRTVEQTRSDEGHSALLLALRSPDGGFTSNPPPQTALLPGTVVIAIGTPDQLDDLRKAASAHGR